MLDDLDRRIVAILVNDARISLKELAERVKLSSPSVSERLRRLEDRGVIRSFTVDVDLQALGYPLQAIVKIKPLPGQIMAVQKMIEETPEFCDCDKITGENCFLARLYLSSMEQLDQILDLLAEKAEIYSSIVKSRVIRHRIPPPLSC